jgi:hypothetical protein
MTHREIIMAISTQTWSLKQLDEIVQAVTYSRDSLARNIIRRLNVGDTVKWNSKHGMVKLGVVERIAIKYVTVKTLNEFENRWKVPASMLTLVENDELVLKEAA